METAIAPLDVPFDYADGNGLMLVVEGSRNRDRPLMFPSTTLRERRSPLMWVVEGSGNRDHPPCIVPFDYADGNGDRLTNLDPRLLQEVGDLEGLEKQFRKGRYRGQHKIRLSPVDLYKTKFKL